MSITAVMWSISVLRAVLFPMSQRPLDLRAMCVPALLSLESVKWSVYFMIRGHRKKLSEWSAPGQSAAWNHGGYITHAIYKLAEGTWDMAVSRNKFTGACSISAVAGDWSHRDVSTRWDVMTINHLDTVKCRLKNPCIITDNKVFLLSECSVNRRLR